MSFMELPSEAELRSRWKWFVGFGVVLVILGAIALWNVVDATLVTTIFIGWLLVLGGIVQIIGAFATSGSMGARVLMGVVGILYAIVGLNIVADPLQGAVALTIVIAIVLIVEGIDPAVRRVQRGDTAARPGRGARGDQHLARPVAVERDSDDSAWRSVSSSASSWCWPASSGSSAASQPARRSRPPSRGPQADGTNHVDRRGSSSGFWRS